MDHIYWYIGGGFTTMAALLGILYKITNGHSSRLNQHDITFAKLETIPGSLQGLVEKVDKLMVSVAVIKNNLSDNENK